MVGLDLVDTIDGKDQMPGPDFSEFQLLSKGNSFEDFREGQVFDHHWGRTLTESDTTLFATITHSFTPLYFNVEYARAQGHPSIVVQPLLLLATVVGLSVEDLSEGGGPFLGLNNAKFHRPVYPGDTITARSTVLSTRESQSRPNFGIVTWHTEAFNQRDELVLDYERSNLITKRGA